MLEKMFIASVDVWVPIMCLHFHWCWAFNSKQGKNVKFLSSCSLPALKFCEYRVNSFWIWILVSSHLGNNSYLMLARPTFIRLLFPSLIKLLLLHKVFIRIKWNNECRMLWNCKLINIASNIVMAGSHRY